MTLSEWYTPLLIGIDVLVVIYGLRVAFTEKKTYGWFLALAFFLFGIKEVLPYNGVTHPLSARAGSFRGRSCIRALRILPARKITAVIRKPFPCFPVVRDGARHPVQIPVKAGVRKKIMNDSRRIYPVLHSKESGIKREMPVNDEGRASKWLNVSCSAGMRNPGRP